MTAPLDSYSTSTGGTIFGGLPSDDSPHFDSAFVYEEYANGLPGNTSSKVLVLDLHGSGSSNLTAGRQYHGVCSGLMAYGDETIAKFSTVLDTNPAIVKLRLADRYINNGVPRESAWLGFTNIGTTDYTLITQRRLEALMSWAETNLQYLPNKTCVRGGSMGGWGTMTFGLRRPHIFAALYPDRPRWRYTNIVGNVAVANWNAGFQETAVGNAPNLRAEDGGGSINNIFDCIAYVSNTANKIPWIGWCVGRQDGFTQFSDHIAAVNAMRAAKRGFAFAWNNGNHSGGSIPTQITNSYNYGTFEVGKGYPLFTNHSDDQDPEVDLVGGINLNLKFRNVVESNGSWSCEITSIAGTRTVDVEPISDIFTATVAPKNILIPEANTWVPVTFTA